MIEKSKKGESSVKKWNKKKAAALLFAGVALVAAVLLLAPRLLPEKTRYTPEEKQRLEILRERVPDFFGLDTEAGLKIYANERYQDKHVIAFFSGDAPGPDRDELLYHGLRGVTPEDARLILSTYDLSGVKITVIPVRGPLYSSYHGSDDATYVRQIRKLLDLE